MTLAEKILSLRTQRGMSQDDLAEKLEVSRQSVSKWETAQSTPDLDKIIKLANLFGVTVDELVREGEAPQPPEPPAPDADEPDMPPPDTASPHTENPDVAGPDMAAPHTENPAQLNINQFKTQKSNTQRSNTHSFPPPTPSETPAQPVEGMKEIFEKRDEIRDQIEYDLIVTPSNREQLNEFVEIMLEVALSRTPTMKIGRDAEYPTAFVRQRFEQITSAHIEKVLDGIQENTTRVWNTRAYLLAALFNAPSTMDNHYTMLVNHDLNGGN